MKKALTILIILVGTNSYAQQLQCNPYKLADERGFKIYQDECGGFGSESSCYAESLITSEKNMTINVRCSYAGEPDYSDSLNMDISINLENCTISKEVIKSCYQN